MAAASPATLGVLVASLTAVFCAFLPLWIMMVRDRRGRRIIRERLSRLGETEFDIRREPYFGSWRTNAGLTGGSLVYRVSARTPAGEKHGHEWAYDAWHGGLKTLARGVWIPLA